MGNNISPPKANVVRPLVGTGSQASRDTERREYTPFRRPSFTAEIMKVPAQAQRQLTQFAREVEKATIAARTIPPFMLLLDVSFTTPSTIVSHDAGVAFTSWAFERIRVGVASAYETDNDSDANVKAVLDKKQITFTVTGNFTANLKVYF